MVEVSWAYDAPSTLLILADLGRDTDGDHGPSAVEPPRSPADGPKVSTGIRICPATACRLPCPNRCSGGWTRGGRLISTLFATRPTWRMGQCPSGWMIRVTTRPIDCPLPRMSDGRPARSEYSGLTARQGTVAMPTSRRCWMRWSRWDERPRRLSGCLRRRMDAVLRAAALGFVRGDVRDRGRAQAVG